MSRKEVLERKLRKLRKEIEAVEAELLSNHGVVARNAPVSSPFSLQGRVINHTIKLITLRKSPVSSKDILESLRDAKIDLGHYPPMMLAAVLGQEVNKKSARLVRVARGLYLTRDAGVPVRQEKSDS